jgi:hypothetical protein
MNYTTSAIPGIHTVEPELSHQEAKEIFLKRLKEAYDAHYGTEEPNPTNVHYISLEEKGRNTIEGIERVRARKQHVKQERKRFTDALHREGIEARDYLALAKEAGNNIRSFMRSVMRVAPTSLVHLEKKSPFLRIMVILRDLYAEDIAHNLLYKDAVECIINEVLLRP